MEAEFKLREAIRGQKMTFVGKKEQMHQEVGPNCNVIWREKWGIENLKTPKWKSLSVEYKAL